MKNVEGTKKKLTRVDDDPLVIELKEHVAKANMKLAEHQARVERYRPVCDPHYRSMSTRSFSEEEVFTAQTQWVESQKNLAFAELEMRSLEAKLIQAKKAASQQRVPELRARMREALAKLYHELEKVQRVNAEVVQAHQLACEILGSNQREIPSDLAWPELQSSQHVEGLLEFRQAQARKAGWL